MMHASQQRVFKVAQNSFQHFPRLRFLWVIGNTLYQSMILMVSKNGDGQNTDPQSMDYPNGLPKWTTQMDYPIMDYP